MSWRAFDRAASCLSAASFGCSRHISTRRRSSRIWACSPTRPRSQRMIGMRAGKLVEALGGPIQLLGLRLGVQQRPGVLHLRDGPLEIQRRAQVGRQVFAGFEPIDLERRVLVIAALAQPAKKGQLVRRASAAARPAAPRNDQRQGEQSPQNKPASDDGPRNQPGNEPRSRKKQPASLHECSVRSRLGALPPRPWK